MDRHGRVSTCMSRAYLWPRTKGALLGSPNLPWFVLGLDVPFPHLTAQNSGTAVGWGGGAGVPGLACPGHLRAQTCSDTSLRSQLPRRQRPQQTPTRVQRFRFAKPPVTTLPLGPYRRSSPVPLGILVQETTPGHMPGENRNSDRHMHPNVHCSTIHNSQDTEAT